MGVGSGAPPRPAELAAYAIVAYGPAYALDYTLILPLMGRASGSLEGQLGLLAALLARMALPALGALAAYIAAGRPGGLMDWLGVNVRGPRWLLAGALAAVSAYTLSLPFSALAGLRLGLCGPLGEAGILVVAAYLVLGVAAGLTVNALAALGEEAGWRGYLLRRLSGVLGFWRAALVVGVAWGLWHAPLVLEGYDYDVESLEGCGEGARGPLALAAFILYTTAAGAVAALLWAGSGGVLAPAAFHGAINGVAGLYASLVWAPGYWPPQPGSPPPPGSLW